jgi:hypothetical protein
LKQHQLLVQMTIKSDKNELREGGQFGLERGGLFKKKSGGQFGPKQRGQLQPKTGGQFDRNFQLSTVTSRGSSNVK